MTRASARAGLAFGDVLLALAGLALAAAVLYPRVERALMRRAAASAQADVETVRSAAAEYRKEAGAWPSPAEPGEIPAELAGHLPQGFSFQPGPYTLDWDRWEAVDLPAPPAADEPAPPTPEPPPAEADTLAAAPAGPPDTAAVVPVRTMGAVTVYSDDARLLAVLLERFGDARSFVRERSWTLVLPPGADR